MLRDALIIAVVLMLFGIVVAFLWWIVAPRGLIAQRRAKARRLNIYPQW